MGTQTRAPTGDSAFSSGSVWSIALGSRYAAIADYPDSGGSTVLTEGTAGGYGLFTFSPFTVPAGATNIVLTLRGYARRNGGGSAHFQFRHSLNGGMHVSGANHIPANGVLGLFEHSFTVNAATGLAWTVDQINGIGSTGLATIGVNGADTNPTISYASLQAEVTYTDPSSNSGWRSFRKLGVDSAISDVSAATIHPKDLELPRGSYDVLRWREHFQPLGIPLANRSSVSASGGGFRSLWFKTAGGLSAYTVPEPPPLRPADPEVPPGWSSDPGWLAIYHWHALGLAPHARQIQDHTLAVSGSIALSGTAPLVRTRITLPTGAVTFTGTSSFVRTFELSAEGVLLFEATAPYSRIRTQLGAGTVTFSGTAALFLQEGAVAGWRSPWFKTAGGLGSGNLPGPFPNPPVWHETPVAWAADPGYTAVYSWHHLGISVQARHTFNYTLLTSGGITLAYADSSLFRYVNVVPSGGFITFSGTGALNLVGSAVYILAAGGLITFTGDGALRRVRAQPTAGQVVFSGFGATRYVKVAPASGLITFSGASPMQFLPEGVVANSQRMMRGHGQ